MASLHSIHVHMNAIADARRNMKVGRGSEYCIDCGEPIPLARRNIIQGCDTCIGCQTLRER